jgi:hypothetical protein
MPCCTMTKFCFDGRSSSCGAGSTRPVPSEHDQADFSLALCKESKAEICLVVLTGYYVSLLGIPS